MAARKDKRSRSIHHMITTILTCTMHALSSQLFSVQFNFLKFNIGYLELSNEALFKIVFDQVFALMKLFYTNCIDSVLVKTNLLPW